MFSVIEMDFYRNIISFGWGILFTIGTVMTAVLFVSICQQVTVVAPSPMSLDPEHGEFSS